MFHPRFPHHDTTNVAAVDSQSGRSLHPLRHELHRRIAAAYNRMQCTDNAAAAMKAREAFEALALELARLADVPAVTSAPGFDGRANTEGM